ncbi:DUF1398 domain-containing protein [Roseomonas sp. CAU 1739]|uniref:DUF1398 domain-containing protein n=1 Tax=Roseomonas sp. CAU 1739 TaxID=3140364 RepID=UPI00325BE1CF
MDDLLAQLAATSLHDAEHGTRSFPQIVRSLMEAGFESYAIDFRRGTATYYLPDGDSVVVPTRLNDTPIAPAFDVAAVQAAIHEAQQLVPGYSYPGFCTKVMRAGCVGYVVSFPGRRAVYSGRTAETHVEVFPT